ncbi:MAG: CDP-alcohol phosphatidyltransferase family protein [Planctomycetaceae bacterium]|nr:CDP-alcohol phosphatidyltransferase family protein [Planctomycetaceae bacterium]
MSSAPQPPSPLDSQSWEEFSRRCLKSDPLRRGTWTARRWGRPAALRITCVVAPHGITAHQATLSACAAAVVAVVAFGWGSPLGWLCGVFALHAWYLLDHVDGQLARFRGTASLDGTWLDYLMHHNLNLLLPAAIGFGLARHTGFVAWAAVGLWWGWGSLLLGLRHDAKYKAFVRRWKSLEGELRLVGGGGGRPEPAYLPPRSFRRWLNWCVLKCYETHIVICGLTMLTAARLLAGEFGEEAAQLFVAAAAVPAPLLACNLIRRSLAQGETEAEFAAWFRLPDAAELEEVGDAWHIRRNDANDSRTSNREPAGKRPS